ncbi:MFS transporter [Reyranella sp.]|uniref:MFS transporter n=1 Tax=Reyranella sp. TaxID=1929291 RepID=UPI003BA98DFD
MTTDRRSGARLVAIVCAAQVFVQIGAYYWPALLPQMMERWSLSNGAAGWITSSFYAAYMLSVPVLVTLTDRIDAKRVYLFGVGCTVVAHLAFGLFAEGFWSAMALRALAGIGWAGTYMTGLKLLADQVDAKMMSRAVTGHAASIGISGALSYMLGDLLSQTLGWQAAFASAGVTAAIAWLTVALSVPGRPPPASAAAATPQALFDFRPVLRNRSAFAYSLAYCVHTLEMNALRGWGVAFLAWVAASQGAVEGILSPTTVVTVLGLLGTLTSVVGNEASIRFGRRRLVIAAMVLSIGLGATIGFVGAHGYWLAVILVVVYGAIIWLDSSSLTAGAAGAADPARRGATLAVHSMLGYAGGFVGPLAIGWTLDAAGGMSPLAWGLAFALVAALMALALVAFAALRPRGLAGDRL